MRPPTRSGSCRLCTGRSTPTTCRKRYRRTTGSSVARPTTSTLRSTPLPLLCGPTSTGSTGTRGSSSGPWSGTRTTATAASSCGGVTSRTANTGSARLRNTKHQADRAADRVPGGQPAGRDPQQPDSVRRAQRRARRRRGVGVRGASPAERSATSSHRCAGSRAGGELDCRAPQRPRARPVVRGGGRANPEFVPGGPELAAGTQRVASRRRRSPFPARRSTPSTTCSR